MTLFELILLSFGLATDATAVSFACSAGNPKIRKAFLIKAALLFGVFQAAMPILGYIAGLTIKESIESLDHWIAFLLLSVIGTKMILESGKKDKECNFSNNRLLVLAIATSIDALVVGVTFSFVPTNLLFNILIIGITTFILSLSGGLLAQKISNLSPTKLKIAGGSAIVLIGLKILISHLA